MDLSQEAISSQLVPRKEDTDFTPTHDVKHSYHPALRAIIQDSFMEEGVFLQQGAEPGSQLHESFMLRSLPSKRRARGRLPWEVWRVSQFVSSQPSGNGKQTNKQTPNSPLDPVERAAEKKKKVNSISTHGFIVKLGNQQEVNV